MTYRSRLCLYLIGIISILLVLAGAPQKGPPEFHDDPPPQGLNKVVRVSPKVVAQAISGVCDGDGISGNRIQVLYVRASDVASQYTTYLSSFQDWAVGVDTIINNSAQQTGGTRHIRFVHDSSCIPVVTEVQLSTTGDDSFSDTMTELQRLGYTRTDRKYLLFVDSHVYCGIATVSGDDSNLSTNLNNTGPDFARVDAGCWSSAAASHEVTHMLGGVQLSAPHSSGGWHCIDEYDRMCYSDAPNYPAMQYLCPDTNNELLLDCNHDDYFNTNPVPGSYLATHWNVANNQFLIGYLIQATPTPCIRGNSGKPCK